MKMSSNVLLSHPPWPQLDHRTAEAIASGLVLGLENKTKFEFNNTIGKMCDTVRCATTERSNTLSCFEILLVLMLINNSSFFLFFFLSFFS